MATEPTTGPQRQEVRRGSRIMAKLPVQSTFVKPNTIGSRRTAPRLVLGIQMETSEEIRGLILIEVLESLGGWVVALVCFGNLVTHWESRNEIRTLLRCSIENARKRRLTSPYGPYARIISLMPFKTCQPISMLCLSGIDIFHLVL